MVQAMQQDDVSQDRSRTERPMPRVYRTARERAEDNGQTGLFSGRATGTIQVKEKDVQRQIRDYLSAKGIFNVRYNTGMAVAEYKGRKRVIRYHDLGPGAADIQALIETLKPGAFRVLWIECKAPKGQQSVAQMGFEQMVRRRGMEYVVARSIDDLKEYL